MSGRINFSQPRGPSEYQRAQHALMAARDKAIRRAHAEGKSTAAIAAAHGLTRQRVWQIVSAR
jgi:hypothetical protein